MATSETRVCQNCKNSFLIEPEDFDFYKKIQVPAPTWCGQCRRQRRLAFRNERSLYKGICVLCKRPIISMYAPRSTSSGQADSLYQVACLECWWSDKWNPEDYAMEYDFSKPFFAQLDELFKKVPRPPFMQRNSVNSPYANPVVESKDVYLSYSIVESEDIYYSKSTDKSKHLFDCLQVAECERCYDNVFCRKNYQCVGCTFSEACIDSWFLYDCANCQNCVLSTNLRKRQYVIRNKQYTKEEYFKELQKLRLETASGFESARREFVELLEYKAIHKYANAIKTVHSTGDNITNTNNVQDAFDLYDLEDSKHGLRLFRSKDCMDADYTFNNELVYEYISGGKQLYQAKFNTYALENLKYIEYTDNCGSSSYLFGCEGLRNKQYCILNKQYSKEEYDTLREKIIAQMNTAPYQDALGREYRYGEFFPPDLSPFAYNETIAQEHMPLDEQTALAKGFHWRKEEEKHHTVTRQASELPDSIADVSDDILKQVIGCPHAGRCHEQCSTAYRILQSELDFYRSMKLPLPRLCPNCRHYQRMKLRNPLQLWQRTCMCNIGTHFHTDTKCPNQFQTSYAADRRELVYCEQCYQAEVL